MAPRDAREYLFFFFFSGEINSKGTFDYKYEGFLIINLMILRHS